MGDIITSISETLVGMIEAVASGLGSAVTQLVFTTGTDGARELSDFSKLAFAIFGVTLGITIVFAIFGWIRGN